MAEWDKHALIEQMRVQRLRCGIGFGVFVLLVAVDLLLSPTRPRAGDFEILTRLVLYSLGGIGLWDGWMSAARVTSYFRPTRGGETE